MSQSNEPSSNVTIPTAESDAAALGDLEKLRPAGTSNSAPAVPVGRARRFLWGVLNSGRPISKTDIIPPEVQVHAQKEFEHPNIPIAEQHEAIWGVEPVASSKIASKIKSWIVPIHAHTLQEQEGDRPEDGNPRLGEYDAISRGLRDDLSRRMVKYECRPNTREFLPTRKLIKLFSVSTLEKELRVYDSFLAQDPRLQFLRFDFSPDPIPGETTAGTQSAIITAAEQIYGNANELVTPNASSDQGRELQTRNKRSHDRSFVKILAVLILIDRPARIKLFVDEGICDADLPLSKITDSRATLRLGRKSAPDEPLRCFDIWDPLSVERFEKYQWKFLAPSFKHGTGKKINHVHYKPEEILPFTYYGNNFQSGGFGQVTKVRIHPDYHTFQNDFPYKRCVAVKRLVPQENVELAFQREVAVLRRHSNDLAHQHLISLLCTYEQDKMYNLVFPWAKADLVTFWKTVSVRKQDKDLRWLAEQCEGIAEGLSYIHHHSTHSGTSLVHKGSKEALEKMKLQNGNACILLFGRHGDIKPENILWFPGPCKGWKRGRRKGILKLADFGVADFSTKDESHESFDASRHQLTAQSPTYRSPENDFNDQHIGSSYDVWSLGCVYLEFIAWWFGGWSLVSKFSEDRVADDAFWTQKKKVTQVVLRVDTFFEIIDNTAIAKAAVLKLFNDLEHHHQRNEFTNGFLRMIRDDMLVPVGKDQIPGRKSAKQVAMVINDLRERQGWKLPQP